MSLRCSRYTAAALGLWLGALALVATVNVAVDPYCVYRVGPTVFDEHRPTYARADVKAERVATVRPAVVIMGTSRALAFDPAWPEWGGAPVYNLSLPGSSMREIAAAFRFAAAHAPVKKLWLAVDFSQFGRPDESSPFQRSKFSSTHSPFNYHLQNLLSIDSLHESRETIEAWAKGELSTHTALGDARPIATPAGAAGRFGFVYKMRRFQRDYTVYRRSPEEMNAFRDVLKTCRAAGVEITVLAPPIHAVHLEAIAEHGLWGEYEAWLGDVVAAVADECGDDAPVWDFAGYNRYTTEPPPRVGGPGMEYYHEASHFTRSLARKTFERAMNSPGAEGDFGVRLTRENVNSRTAELRAERAAWLARRPEALALLEEIYPRRLAKNPVDANVNLK